MATKPDWQSDPQGFIQWVNANYTNNNGIWSPKDGVTDSFGMADLMAYQQAAGVPTNVMTGYNPLPSTIAPAQPYIPTPLQNVPQSVVNSINTNNAQTTQNYNAQNWIDSVATYNNQQTQAQNAMAQAAKLQAPKMESTSNKVAMQAPPSASMAEMLAKAYYQAPQGAPPGTMPDYLPWTPSKVTWPQVDTLANFWKSPTGTTPPPNNPPPPTDKPPPVVTPPPPVVTPPPPVTTNPPGGGGGSPGVLKPGDPGYTAPPTYGPGMPTNTPPGAQWAIMLREYALRDGKPWDTYLKDKGITWDPSWNSLLGGDPTTMAQQGPNTLGQGTPKMAGFSSSMASGTPSTNGGATPVTGSTPGSGYTLGTGSSGLPIVGGTLPIGSPGGPPAGPTGPTTGPTPPTGNPMKPYGNPLTRMNYGQSRTAYEMQQLLGRSKFMNDDGSLAQYQYGAAPYYGLLGGKNTVRGLMGLPGAGTPTPYQAK